MKISTSLRLCTSAIALLTASTAVMGAANAQQATSTEAVTVTGTRITNGAAMPTPVTTVDAEMLQQAPAVPRVLRRDHIRGGERIAETVGSVGEVADGRARENDATGHVASVAHAPVTIRMC